MLSRHDSKAAPQTVQTASPVCGTKNFSSVRLYSAPQSHCTIVAIPRTWASDRRFSSPKLCHIEILVAHDKQVADEAEDRAVGEQPPIAKQDRLAENDGGDRHLEGHGHGSQDRA